MKRYTVLGLALALALGALIFWTGTSTKSIVEDPTEVFGYRFEPRGAPLGEVEPSIAQYRLRSGPVSVGGEALLKLQEVLTSREFGEWDQSAKRCLPSYEVAAEFKRGDNSLEAIFCLGCLMFYVLEDGNPVLSAANFDEMDVEVAQAFRAVFPEDEAVQEAASKILRHLE